MENGVSATRFKIYLPTDSLELERRHLNRVEDSTTFHKHWQREQEKIQQGQLTKEDQREHFVCNSASSIRASWNHLREIQSHVEYLTGTSVSTQNLWTRRFPFSISGELQSYQLNIWTTSAWKKWRSKSESLSILALARTGEIPSRQSAKSRPNSRDTNCGKAKTRRKTRILLCQP